MDRIVLIVSSGSSGSSGSAGLYQLDQISIGLGFARRNWLL